MRESDVYRFLCCRPAQALRSLWTVVALLALFGFAGNSLEHLIPDVHDHAQATQGSTPRVPDNGPQPLPDGHPHHAEHCDHSHVAVPGMAARTLLAPQRQLQILAHLESSLSDAVRTPQFRPPIG